MSSAEAVFSSPAAVLDVAALLAPIPGDNPAGEKLLYAGLYDQIREARRADEGMEAGAWKLKETKSANWPLVVKLATDALAKETKDLQVCAWLIEAVIKQHGFVGLRDGLQVMRGLHAQFWEHLYPEIDEGDLEGRANCLAWLNRQATLAIKDVGLTSSITGVNYSYLQWENSKQFDIPDEEVDKLPYEEREHIKKLIEQATEEKKITSKQWRTAKNATSPAFFVNLAGLLNECWIEIEALDEVMDEKFGSETPGLGALKKALEEIRSLAESLAPHTVAPPPPGPDPPIRPSGNGGEPTPLVVRRDNNATWNRQEALNRLTEIADDFRKHEPHSPVSYLVQRAIKWGQMPLDTWLQDVIKDGSALENLRETLGLIKSPEEG
ncbi:MAG: type secretion system protein ImpA [Blastocatellia bacterium]